MPFAAAANPYSDAASSDSVIARQLPELRAVANAPPMRR
jgi:hypothetical protein